MTPATYERKQEVYVERLAMIKECHLQYLLQHPKEAKPKKPSPVIQRTSTSSLDSNAFAGVNDDRVRRGSLTPEYWSRIKGGGTLKAIRRW